MQDVSQILLREPLANRRDRRDQAHVSDYATTVGVDLREHTDQTVAVAEVDAAAGEGRRLEELNDGTPLGVSRNIEGFPVTLGL